MNKKLLIFVILLLALSLGVFKLFSKNPETILKDKLSQFLESKELSSEEYAVVKKEFLTLMGASNPKIVLAELRERIKTDATLLRSCHSLVHDIGHAAYEKYKDFGGAMKYQDEICNSGYLHGIIETHFSKSSDLFAEMQTVCEPYPLGKFSSWECYHGVGHGVMYYTNNDLPKSLQLCGQYKNDFARRTCENGVFMENFNADQKLHISKFLKEEDPFYPCREQASRYKGDCFLYAPTYYLSLHKNDYVDALKWCEGAESSYKLICAVGVGSQAIKENISTPKFVEEVCMSGGTSQVEPCIEGMIGLFVNHHGSLEPARVLCEQLEPSNRKACYSSINSSSELFN